MKRKQTLHINPDAILRNIAEVGMSKAEAGRQMGHSDTYINQVVKTEHMAQSNVLLFCFLYSVEEDEILYHEPEAPKAEAPCGYHAEIDVKDTKVSFTLMFGGNPLAYGQSTILEDGSLATLQAISYAAYAAYRNARKEAGQDAH